MDRQTLQRDVARVNETLRKSNRFIIKPHGQFMLTLDIATTFSLLFTAIVTPYEIAFLSEFAIPLLIVINYIIFGVFAIGIVVTFCLPYREPLYKVRCRNRAFSMLSLALALPLLSTGCCVLAASSPTLLCPNLLP